MACTTCQSTTPNGCICQPGRKGDPGPKNTITLDVTTIPAGESPIVVSTGVSPNQHFTIGFPLSPIPTLSATAVTGPIGVTTGGTTEAPIFNFTVPVGADGTNGQSRFTRLANSFQQPAPGLTVVITVDSTAWMSLNDWIYIGQGGWYVVASNPLSATQILIRNPGTADLTPLWGTAPSSLPWSGAWYIPFNTTAGATITPSGYLNQVAESGIPGTRGATGATGITPVIGVTPDVPGAAPPTEADAFVIYVNAVAPNRATQVIPYTWNYGTLAWEAGPNMAGEPGTQIFNGAADPNVVPPGGSAIGDIYLRYAGNVQTSYRKISSSAWTQFGIVPTTGSITQTISHTSAGTQTLDLAYLSYNIQADKDLELDWDSANFDQQAEWLVSITNLDGSSPIALTYTVGQWEKDPALTLPSTIAAGVTQTLRFIKDEETGLYIFTSEFIAVAV